MKLNAKIGLILILSNLGLLSLLALGLNMMVMPRFEELEQRQLIQHHERLERALTSDFDELARLARDWGVWDDTYAFMQGQGPDYIDSNISVETFTNLQLDALLLFDAQGRLRHAYTHDPVRHEVVPDPGFEIGNLAAAITRAENNKRLHGFFVLEGTLYRLAFSPILDNESARPTLGYLVMLRRMSSSYGDVLAERTRLSLSLTSLGRAALTEAQQQAYTELQNRPYWLNSGKTPELAVYSLLRDLDQRPIVLMRIGMKPDIYRQGRQALNYFLGFSVLALFVLGPVLFLVLHRLVVRRLHSMGQVMLAIGDGRGSHQRMPAQGRDELAELAGSVNRMLDGLDAAYVAQRRATERQREQNALLVRLATDESMARNDRKIFQARLKTILPQGAQIERWSLWWQGRESSLRLQDQQVFLSTELPPLIEPARLDVALAQLRETRRSHALMIGPALGCSERAVFLGRIQTEEGEGLACVEIFGPGRNWPADEENFLVSATALIERFMIGRLQRWRTEELRHRAESDPLTGLANRAGFELSLRTALAAAPAAQQGLAVLFIDLDRFKPVNDDYGHAVGDWLLKQVAQRLREQVRSHDLVARLGGDEFVVVLNSMGDAETAARIGQKLGDALRRPFAHGELLLQIGGSIGVACYPQHASSYEALVHAADLAMYAAKQGGRDNCRVYDGAALTA